MYQVSIIIPTAHPSTTLVDVLGLSALEHCHRSLEVIVVDNAFGGATLEIEPAVARHRGEPRIFYHRELTPGLVAGRHRGAAEATSELLLYLDDDVRVGPGWLAAVLEAFERPDVHLVGGPILPEYEVDPPRWLDEFWHRSADGGSSCGYLSLLDFGGQIKEIDPAYVWGANFAIRKSTLIELGGFHPDGVPWKLRRYRGDGETAVSAAAREAGLKAMYHPGALVHHHVPRSRMTVDYFKRRAFLQGISDSYTKIRQDGDILELLPEAESEPAIKPLVHRFRRYARRPVHHARNFLRRRFRGGAQSRTSRGVEDSEVANVKQRVRVAYHAGYEFHQDEVRKDPELLKWVLRPDYWDHRLPKNARSYAPDLPNEALQDK